MPGGTESETRASRTGAPNLYVRAMDRLYWLCIAISVVSIVAMTALIFTGVVMRYVFLMGARFAEPMSIFFIVQLTMYGAAACYRAHAHLRMDYFVGLLPDRWRRAPDWMVHALMAGVAVAMIWYGLSLARTTWFQSYPEFEYVRVGLVYSGIPGSGLVLLLFIVEAAIWPRAAPDLEREEVEHGREQRSGG